MMTNDPVYTNQTAPHHHGHPLWREDDRYRSGCRFAWRVWQVRLVALSCMFLAIAGVLSDRNVSGWWWLVLTVWAFLWPHLARQLDYRSLDPFVSERRNLYADAAIAGALGAIMGLNLLPCLLLLMMTCMNTVGAGGVKLLLPALLTQGVTLLGTLWLVPVPVELSTSLLEIVLCAPMLLLYPLMFGYISFRTAVNLAEHKRELQQLSTRDGMTGLYNRRHWEYLLQNEYENCQRYHRPSALILVDIDHFKTINDTWGHDIGDEAIVAVTQHLLLTLRGTDVIGRFGGDEFAVIMSGINSESAAAAAGRLHEQLERYRLPGGTQTRLHISVGVAEFSPGMRHYREWLKAADVALYKAKNAGRNRTEVAA